MSQQKADDAGMDVMHVMLFHCIWRVSTAKINGYEKLSSFS